MPSININDLNNAKADVDHIAAVATSTAPTTADRLGRIKLTLQGAMINIGLAADAVMAGLGYSPPVTYATGLSMTLRSQTVTYAGNTYAPNSGSLPFVTSGTFETAKFRLIQGIVFADLAAALGSSLMGFIQLGVGAIKRSVQDELRERVSVMGFGAKGDGVTDDTAAFANAAARAAEIGTSVEVPAPSVSYLLNSSPTIPRNTGVLASPSWFSGPGLMPFHYFIQRSEGINPRAFKVKLMSYAESIPNYMHRLWNGVFWTNVTDSPAAGYEGTLTDAVSIDGRIRVAAPNAQGWAQALLGQLEGAATGTAQVLVQEIDANNFNRNCDTDTSPIIRGSVVVSGGDYRPRSAYFVQATRTPTNGLGDNRWNFGLAFYTDSCYEANIYIYDGNRGDAIRIPSTSRGAHWTANSNLDNYYMRVNSTTFLLELTISPNRSFDILNNAGQRVVSFSESTVDYSKPINYSNGTYFSVPANVNVDFMDQITFGAAGVIAGGLVGSSAGHRLVTLINASGAPVTINRNANMRTAGGGAVVLAHLQCVLFACSGGTFFQIGAPSANA
jgi:hypothetical protein